MANVASNQCGRVRVLARIRNQLSNDGEPLPVSKPWIVVSRPEQYPNSNSNSNSTRVKISFNSEQITSSKQSYEVDECYEQEVGNHEIFEKEIKPLIAGLFGGQNSTVFAFGPRGSGKTFTIQGTEKEFGLPLLALESILPRALEEQKVVNLSVFEVSQDRIMDLLDSKRSEVSVFEDAQGKIRLKGLSKVKVNSAEEFQRLYTSAVKTRMQKAAEPAYRSHIGCILHIVSPQTENSSAQLVGKIHFIELASYEDSRRKSSDGVNLSETTRIKKSLTAVHNVLYALNAKENRVPYRESKLTRMLQNSLGRVVMISCMNHFFCPETIQTISMASRSCIAGFLAYLDPGNSGRSGGKTIRKSSPQVLKSASKLSARTNLMSPKVMKPINSSTSGRKQPGSHLRMSVRKETGGLAIQAKGRKLFTETNQAKTPKMEKKGLGIASSMRSTTQTEVTISFQKDMADDSTQQEEISTVTVHSSTDSSQVQSEMVKCATDATSELKSFQVHSEQVPSQEVSIQNDYNVVTTPLVCQTPTTTASVFLNEDKENRVYDEASPPLSARLREISNDLKSLCMSSEATLKASKEFSTLSDQVIHEKLEPKTPNFQPVTKAYGQYELSASPWTSFNMKEALAQQCLKFLNTANKEELKGVKGIGETRATYILELREETPEPFKVIDDLKDIGIGGKQIKELMKNIAGSFIAESL